MEMISAPTPGAFSPHPSTPAPRYCASPLAGLLCAYHKYIHVLFGSALQALGYETDHRGVFCLFQRRIHSGFLHAGLWEAFYKY